MMSNKFFWKTVKPFLTRKGNFSSDFIRIEIKGDLVSDEKQIVELFNENYINIVGKSSGKKPSSVGTSGDGSSCESNVKETIFAYSSYLSILLIKNDINFKISVELPKTNCTEINKIIHFLNTDKAIGPDLSKNCNIHLGSLPFQKKVHNAVVCPKTIFFNREKQMPISNYLKVSLHIYNFCYYLTIIRIIAIL